MLPGSLRFGARRHVLQQDAILREEALYLSSQSPRPFATAIVRSGRPELLASTCSKDGPAVLAESQATAPLQLVQMRISATLAHGERSPGSGLPGQTELRAAGASHA